MVMVVVVVVVVAVAVVVLVVMLAAIALRVCVARSYSIDVPTRMVLCARERCFDLRSPARTRTIESKGEEGEREGANRISTN